MSSLNDRRREVADLERRATRKVQRLARNGVDISGGKLDVRRRKGQIKRYTQSQLHAYEKELRGFISRKTQYYGDVKGRPISRDAWLMYKRAERAYNKKTAEDFRQYENIRLPNSDETIRQRMEKITPTHRRMAQGPVNAPYEVLERLPKNVASVKDLKRLQRGLEDRVRPGNFEKRLREARDQFSKMIEITGNDELAKEFRGLNDRQTYVLWHFTNFATSVSLQYQMALHNLAKSDAAYVDTIADRSSRHALTYVKWAKSLRL